jgi:hypothetical protein
LEDNKEVHVSELRLDNLRTEVRERIKPFFEEVLGGYRDNIHSIYITGSSITGDFNPKTSDTNSVFVLKEMDLGFLEVIAPRGKKYRKQKVASPLIMTPEYIRNSVDVFPIEFLNIKLIHETVYGEDIFGDIEIHPSDLRHQCERELKVKLISLRQGYMSSMGDARTITDGLTGSITGYIPLFRGIISLFGKSPPVLNSDVLNSLGESAGVDCGIFEKIITAKREGIKPGIDDLNRMFEQYYSATEQLGRAVNEIKV